MFKKAAIAAGSFFLFLSGAVAEDAPLTEESASRFVDSLDTVKALGEALEAEGKTKELQFDSAPKAGEPFKPYSKSVVALKAKYPGDYAKLDAAVKKHGFGAEEWGAVGDRVMVAYLARKMETENPQAMAQMQHMDASMMDMLPPEMKAQMMQAQAMMQAVAAASPEDKKAVAKVEDKLDAYMDVEASPPQSHAGHN